MNQSHAFIMFKLFSLRQGSTDYIALIETLERLYEKHILTKCQIYMLNDYLAGYRVAELNERYHIDCSIELDRLFTILSSITGYTDAGYSKTYIERGKKYQAQTAMIKLSQQYDFVQEVA